ncbi:hypothetical protein FQA47_013008 [Oryzias melastigma]|uniref:Uncharacterized protein n=1 Tax=Oryzias melastigma TaxID=30732 RepID=A0A834FPU2_ORYME|nr:hypothetical protein FQA47_013008 [Oryzias melastigma]
MIHYMRVCLAFPLHQLSSGEPLWCALLSSNYLPPTKLLFVFTGAVQCAESAHQPEPEEEEVSSEDSADERLGSLYTWCSPPDSNAPVPARPLTPRTPHPNSAPCC